MESTNKIVANAIKAVNAGTDIGNTIVKEYRNYVRAQVQDLIQKVGDAQSYLLQQKDRLRDIAASHGTAKDGEVVFATHRRVDAALDAVAAKLRGILGY